MTPPIVTNCASLLAGYDVLFCDVWGVVHDGNLAIPASTDALIRFRQGGGTVILLTNAPQPEVRVAEILDEKQVPRAAWDAVVSSGETALAHVRSHGLQAIYHIGPAARSRPLIEQLPRLVDTIGQADGIVCSGLVDDHRETPEDYRQLLTEALSRRLPFVCANPDHWVHVGEKLLPCAGQLAAFYADMGGEVVWAGKPHAPVYEAAFDRAVGLRRAPVTAARVLAVGDALLTDLAGAANAGIDALFIGSGIHRDDVMRDGAIDPGRLGELFGAEAPPAVAATPALAW